MIFSIIHVSYRLMQRSRKINDAKADATVSEMRCFTVDLVSSFDPFTSVERSVRLLFFFLSFFSISRDATVKGDFDGFSGRLPRFSVRDDIGFLSGLPRCSAGEDLACFSGGLSRFS